MPLSFTGSNSEGQHPPEYMSGIAEFAINLRFKSGLENARGLSQVGAPHSALLGCLTRRKWLTAHLCEQSAVATWVPVTGFRYGNDAKEGHRLQNPLNCFLLLYIFFYDKNSMIFEFEKPPPKGVTDGY